MKDIHDVITHAKFGDDRLRGLGVVAGQISAFPIDFAGRPYNTLALPCERVIFTASASLQSSCDITRGRTTSISRNIQGVGRGSGVLKLPAGDEFHDVVAWLFE